MFCLAFFALCSASVLWVHLWHPQITYMILSVPCYTKYPKFRFLSNILLFVTPAVSILSSTLAAFGTLDLNSASEIFASNTSTFFFLLQYIRNSWYSHIILSIGSKRVSVWLEKFFNISHPWSRCGKHTYCIFLKDLSPCQRLSPFISFNMGSFSDLLATSNTSGSLLHLSGHTHGLQFILKSFVNYFWTRLSALW